MCNYIKSLFNWGKFVVTGKTDQLFNDEGWGGTIRDNTLQLTKGQIEMARIVNKNGKFALVAEGKTVGTYSRKRDAVRGASRRGLVVA